MNPIFLFVLFALGFVFGLLLKNPTAGKFLIFGFVGVFVYEPVRDAGLVASAAFIAGIISHHITLYTLYDMLPNFSGWRRRRMDRAGGFFEQAEQSSAGGRDSKDRGSDRADSSSRDHSGHHEESERDGFAAGGIHHRRGYTSCDPDKRSKSHGRNERQSDAENGREELQKAKEEVERERERLRREKARLDTERKQFANEWHERKHPADTRSDEEILGVSGEYTLVDLKRARNAEVKRWNTSSMVNKPLHLVREAEEEAKKINLAYERLKKDL